MPYRIEKYEDAFDLIGVPLDDTAKKKLKMLENEGHSEKSICFTIWKMQDKLCAFKHDNRFWSIFINEVNKWSWRKDDPRWDDYWKKKNEIKRTERIHKEIQKDYKLNKEANPKKYKGFVYFIQGECGGAIKIGYSKNVSQRLKELQTGYPDVLKVIKMIHGNEAREALIHEELAGYRLNGEWFRPDKFVLDKIKNYI
jgi:hypothetical protein